MSAIAKTIWMIESHFRKPVSLNEMALNAGVSRSHLSRIFPLATGYSISAYLRGRRLSEAAKALASGAPDILCVALEAGYGSHEAFTRAFREQFAVTPDDVRRRRSVDTLELVEPLNMDTVSQTRLPPPRIEMHPAFHIAGLMERIDPGQVNSIPALWQRLQPYLGNVAGAIDGPAFGVVVEADEATCDYLAGMEVAAGAELPPEFTSVQVPARRWARFAHQGHISTIRQTIAAVFQWSPPPQYRPADELGVVEYYGADFDGATGTGTIEIWFGLADA